MSLAASYMFTNGKCSGSNDLGEDPKWNTVNLQDGLLALEAYRRLSGRHVSACIGPQLRRVHQYGGRRLVDGQSGHGDGWHAYTLLILSA